ncbi:MAG: helix-turn-helix domain-containing protein, partial [Roseiflexaceae bacterium]
MPAPQPAALDPAAFAHFGDLLRFLRRRAQLTQRDLGIAVGYNFAQICRLEQGQRLPSRSTVEAVFVPALDLAGSPEWAARLIALADTARQQRDEAAHAATLGRPPAAGRLGTDDHQPPEAIPEPALSEVPRLTLVARLHARLVAERRVALCGLAGIGKTTLAAALAREYAETMPVFWLTFTAGVTTSVEVLLRQLALFLQAHGQPNAAPLLRTTGSVDQALPLDQQIGLLSAAIARLSAGKSGRRAAPPLLCFDNVHLVQDDQAIVHVLRHLSATTTATLLLTSRENLQVLPGCPQVRLSGLELNEGLTLIANLAGPTAGSAAPAWAAGLLEKTGGSPMLLRLAVAELVEAQVAPAAFIAQLADQPQIASYLLETVRRHISPAAWGLLTLLAVFRQPLDLHESALIELIQQTDGAENLPAALAELIQRHLIDHPARAQLHPLVRDYAYSALLTLPLYRRQLHRIAAEWSEQGLDDAVEASYHYCHAGDLADAVATLEDHAEANSRRGQAFAAADMAEVALAQVRRGRPTGRGAGQANELAGRLLVLRGDLLVHTARAQAAEASYREALALSNAADDRARIVYRLALSLTQRGQAGAAVLLCREAAAALAPAEILLRAHLSAAESQAHIALTDYAAA